MTKNVTVQKMLSVLLSRIKFIILITLLTTVLFFTFSKLFITPQYSTSAMIYVQNYKNNTEGANKEANKIYGSDINGSSSLAEVSVTLFENSDELTSLYNDCDVTYTVDSFFITISVSGTDPQVVTNVANQLSDKCQGVFVDYYTYGQIGTIREAKVPSRPYEPNNMKNALIGFAVGLIGSCVIAILLELIDTTIKADDELSDMYGLPVFAEIPDFEGQGR